MIKRRRSYFSRFILLHVLTYTVIGVLFYQLQDYEKAFEAQEYFILFRPVDHPFVMYSMFIQILRGGIMAVLVYPFKDAFMNQKNGWLLLFALIFGLTALGSMVFIPDLIVRLKEGAISQVVMENVVGLPEIVVQILLFSWLMVRWEKKSKVTS